MSRKKEEVTITYDNIISAVLLKYRRLTAIQLIALIEHLKKSPLKNKIGFYYKNISSSFSEIRYKIITNTNGCLELNHSLNERICDLLPGHWQQATLREILTKTAGEELLNYFDQLDFAKITEEYEDKIKANRNRFKKSANVLLIEQPSNNNKFYQALKEYGFEKIDAFASPVRAKKYFKAHPNALGNYQLILDESEHLELHDTCFSQAYDKRIVLTHIGEYQNQQVFSLQDHLHGISKNFRCTTLFDAFDRIVEFSLLNHFDNIEKFLAQGSSPRYKEKLAPKRPLPTKKQDLRILCLTEDKFDSRVSEIVQKYDLNIKFINDNPFAFKEHVYEHLGEYDIIIGTNRFSKSLVFSAAECQEQTKDTGRELTLLFTYDKKIGGLYFQDRNIKEYGAKVYDGWSFYSFSGLLSENHSLEYETFPVLIPVYSGDKTSTQEMYYFLNIVLNQALNTYNKALNKLGGKITDFDIPENNCHEELDSEKTRVVIEQERQSIEETEREYKPINNLDNLVDILKRFLDLRKRKVIRQSIPDLNIYEANDAIFVERLLNHQLLFSIIIPKQNRHENVRVFKVQVRSKKSGKMTPIEDVALFTKWAAADMQTGKLPKYNRPNDLQKDALVSLMLKIQCDIVPLVTEAKNKGLTTDTKKTFKPKK